MAITEFGLLVIRNIIEIGITLPVILLIVLTCDLTNQRSVIFFKGWTESILILLTHEDTVQYVRKKVCDRANSEGLICIDFAQKKLLNIQRSLCYCSPTLSREQFIKYICYPNSLNHAKMRHSAFDVYRRIHKVINIQGMLDVQFVGQSE